MKVLLADDEPLARERLAAALADFADVVLVGEACDGDQALEMIERLRPDVVILDIQMPGISGIRLAEGLGRRPDPPEVIFLTAYGSYAISAFELEATDYLLKPVRPGRLRLALDRARRRLAGRALRGDAARTPDTTSIWIPRGETRVRLSPSAVLWVEAARDYVLIHVADQSYILRETMAGMTSRLAEIGVLRVHRSALVNPHRISAVRRVGRSGVALELEGGAIVRVGRAYAQEVLAMLRIDRPGRA